MQEPYCFCTLAVGDRYRQHAALLAQDLLQYAPQVPLLLLSDQPDDFQAFSNVQAILHHLQSVKGYYDKRFVLMAALERFESCLFVDADVRVLGPLPEQMGFLPGIVARYGCGTIKHNSESKVRPAFELIQTVAQALQLDLTEVLWFHEFMFMITRQKGKEKDFFQAWEAIAHYFQSQGIYDGVGNVMGLAAASSGFDIHFQRRDFFPAFKDNVQKFNSSAKTAAISATPGNATNEFVDEFKLQAEIEYPQRSLHQKISHRLTVQTAFTYRLLKFRLQAIKFNPWQALISAQNHQK